jgi:hypothetical protein
LQQLDSGQLRLLHGDILRLSEDDLALKAHQLELHEVRNLKIPSVTSLFAAAAAVHILRQGCTCKLDGQVWLLNV